MIRPHINDSAPYKYGQRTTKQRTKNNEQRTKSSYSKGGGLIKSLVGKALGYSACIFRKKPSASSRDLKSPTRTL